MSGQKQTGTVPKTKQGSRARRENNASNNLGNENQGIINQRVQKESNTASNKRPHLYDPRVPDWYELNMNSELIGVPTHPNQRTEKESNNSAIRLQEQNYNPWVNSQNYDAESQNSWQYIKSSNLKTGSFTNSPSPSLIELPNGSLSRRDSGPQRIQQPSYDREFIVVKSKMPKAQQKIEMCSPKTDIANLEKRFEEIREFTNLIQSIESKFDEVSSKEDQAMSLEQEERYLKQKLNELLTKREQMACHLEVYEQNEQGPSTEMGINPVKFESVAVDQSSCSSDEGEASNYPIAQEHRPDDENRKIESGKLENKIKMTHSIIAEKEQRLEEMKSKLQQIKTLLTRVDQKMIVNGSKGSLNEDGSSNKEYNKSTTEESTGKTFPWMNKWNLSGLMFQPPQSVGMQNSQSLPREFVDSGCSIPCQEIEESDSNVIYENIENLQPTAYQYPSQGFDNSVNNFFPKMATGDVEKSALLQKIQYPSKLIEAPVRKPKKDLPGSLSIEFCTQNSMDNDTYPRKVRCIPMEIPATVSSINFDNRPTSSEIPSTFPRDRSQYFNTFQEIPQGPQPVITNNVPNSGRTNLSQNTSNKRHVQPSVQHLQAVIKRLVSCLNQYHAMFEEAVVNNQLSFNNNHSINYSDALVDHELWNVQHMWNMNLYTIKMQQQRDLSDLRRKVDMLQYMIAAKNQQSDNSSETILWQTQPPPPPLNNQVPPGNRANNYWDNFRSYSRQNLLSRRHKANDLHDTFPPENLRRKLNSETRLPQSEFQRYEGDAASLSAPVLKKKSQQELLSLENSIYSELESAMNPHGGNPDRLIELITQMKQLRLLNEPNASNTYEEEQVPGRSSTISASVPRPAVDLNLPSTSNNQTENVPVKIKTETRILDEIHRILQLQSSCSRYVLDYIVYFIKQNIPLHRKKIILLEQTLCVYQDCPFPEYISELLFVISNFLISNNDSPKQNKTETVVIRSTAVPEEVLESDEVEDIAEISVPAASPIVNSREEASNSAAYNNVNNNQNNDAELAEADQQSLSDIVQVFENDESNGFVNVEIENAESLMREENQEQ